MAHSDAIAAQRELLAITGERLAGEAKVIDYDPALHPGMLRRGMMAGFAIERMAAIFGVSPDTLKTWIQVHPAMFEAGKDVLMKDAEVVDSLYELAIGWTDPETGKRTKPNAQALMFLARTRLGFAEPSKEQDKQPLDLTADRMMEMVRLLERLMAEGHATDVTEAGEENFDEFA